MFLLGFGCDVYKICKLLKVIPLQGASFKYCYSYTTFGAPLPGRTYQQGRFDAKVVNMPQGTINATTGWTRIFCTGPTSCTVNTSLVTLSTVNGKLRMQTQRKYAQAYYTFTTVPGRVYKVKYRLSGVTFGLTNTSIFAPAQPKELYTSANMSISMVNNVDREMIFTATESSVRFYITRGWAPNGTTASVEEVNLDYLNITEVPSQVNTISCTSINENMVMLANSGVNTADMTTVANILNLYYNRTYTAAEYQAILSHCTSLPASYVLAAAGAEAASVKASYAYGFNGKMLDEEGMGGGGSTYDYGFRIYNAQLGKFLSVDPLTASYAWYTPYQFAGNKPIAAIDLDGLEELIVVRFFDADGKYTGELVCRIPNKDDRIVKEDGTALYVERPEADRQRVDAAMQRGSVQNEFFTKDESGEMRFEKGICTPFVNAEEKKINDVLIAQPEKKVYIHSPLKITIYFEQAKSEFVDKIPQGEPGRIVEYDNNGYINNFSKYFEHNPDYKPVIVGTANSDNQTGNYDNDALSLQRAQTAADKLKKNGVETSPTDIKGNGVTDAGATPTEKKQLNRSATVTATPQRQQQ